MKSSPVVNMATEGLNLSFSGCGFLGMYHVGVASAILQYAPHLTFNSVSGASAGAMAAVCVLSGTCMGDMTSDLLSACNLCRSHIGGPFNPKINITNVIEERLKANLPSNVHELVNGRLHVSVTRVYDGANLLINNFVRKEEVVEAVVGSTFIPIFSGYMPYRYRGVRIIDGGFSVNLPKLNDKTITVSPFAGDASICPLDAQRNEQLTRLNFASMSHNVSFENIMRLKHVLYPPPADFLADLCKSGFQDTIRFLQKNEMIRCTMCLCISSTYRNKEEEHIHTGDNCEICLKTRLDALNDPDLPLQVVSAFDNMVERTNIDLKEKSYLYRSFISVLNYTPVAAASKWVYGTTLCVGEIIISRLRKMIPLFQDNEKMLSIIEGLIVTLVKKFSRVQEVPSTAEFHCDVNITQFGREDGFTDLEIMDEGDHAESDECIDLLSLGISSLFQNGEEQSSHSNADALRFQTENLLTAMRSSHSTVHSRNPSRRGSLIVSNMESLVSSAKTSRRNSIGGALVESEPPQTIRSIIDLSEKGKSVLDLYYRNAEGEFVTMAMYDVTEKGAEEIFGPQIPQESLDPVAIGDRLRLEQQRLQEEPRRRYSALHESLTSDEESLHSDNDFNANEEDSAKSRDTLDNKET